MTCEDENLITNGKVHSYVPHKKLEAFQSNSKQTAQNRVSHPFLFLGPHSPLFIDPRTAGLIITSGIELIHLLSLTLLNSAVIKLNQLIQNLLRGVTQRTGRKLSSLLRDDTAKNIRILHEVSQCFSQRNSKISHNI